MLIPVIRVRIIQVTHNRQAKDLGQRSARDRDHGAQHTSQAQAKDRSGRVPVGKMCAEGFFGTAQGHGRGIQMNMPPTVLRVHNIQVIHSKQAKDHQGTEVMEHNTNQAQAWRLLPDPQDETRTNIFFQ